MMTLRHAIPGCSMIVTQVEDGSLSSNDVFQKKVRCEGKTLVVPHLVHGSGRSEVIKDGHYECDAVFTSKKTIALGIRVADCVPIVCSIPGKGIAVIHGGWRSLLQNIVPLTLIDLCHMTSSEPKDVSLWIGPSLQSCCNVMKEIPIQAYFSEWKNFISRKSGMYAVSLQDAVISQCEMAGVLRKNIHNDGSCTYHQPLEYFSYRRWKTDHKKETGAPHFGVVAWMEG